MVINCDLQYVILMWSYNCFCFSVGKTFPATARFPWNRNWICQVNIFVPFSVSLSLFLSVCLSFILCHVFILSPPPPPHLVFLSQSQTGKSISSLLGVCVVYLFSHFDLAGQAVLPLVQLWWWRQMQEWRISETCWTGCQVPWSPLKDSLIPFPVLSILLLKVCSCFGLSQFCGNVFWFVLVLFRW